MPLWGILSGDVLLVEFMYLVFTRMPGGSCRRRVVCACTEFFGEVGHFNDRSGFLELCVIRENLMIHRVL